MRVLVLASTFPRWPGDHQPTFILDLCRHLPDCEVHVLAPGAPGAADEETVDGICAHRFRYAPFTRWQTLAYDGGMLGNVRGNPLLYLLLPLFLLAQIIAIVRLQRAYGFDVIHAHWIIPQGFCAALVQVFCRRQRPKLLVTAHGSDVYAFNSRMAQALKRFVLRRADRVTAVSAALAGEIRAIAGENIAVDIAPMGIALQTPSSAQIDRHGFCFVGRFVEKKGVLDLVDAWAQAYAIAGEQLPPLTIAGDGPLRNAIEARISAHDLQAYIRLTGWLDRQQVTDLIAGSAFLVMPSRRAPSGDHEGLGLVAVEALALGTPVIAYDFPAIDDIAKLGNGVMRVKEGDVAALAAALVNVGANNRPAANYPAPQVDDVLRAEICRMFSWPVAGAGYRALYGAH